LFYDDVAELASTLNDKYPVKGETPFSKHRKVDDTELKYGHEKYWG
jgi:hypothetical protein